MLLDLHEMKYCYPGGVVSSYSSLIQSSRSLMRAFRRTLGDARHHASRPLLNSRRAARRGLIATPSLPPTTHPHSPQLAAYLTRKPKEQIYFISPLDSFSVLSES
ncbi:unnamed protein product [Arctia plantaginis]|uniref:Uncharacterized protein n=1 Tax=Arctia plantaginis TaxID=874455 RepID=A0A8S0ZAB4_ARCPL|nr:unnamed protein product [Arctia plantaginis]